MSCAIEYDSFFQFIFSECLREDSGLNLENWSGRNSTCHDVDAHQRQLSVDLYGLPHSEDVVKRTETRPWSRHDPIADQMLRSLSKPQQRSMSFNEDPMEELARIERRARRKTTKGEQEIEAFRTALERKLNEDSEGQKNAIREEPRTCTEFSITVTGSALDVIMKKRSLLVSFYRLARHAAVVIACRVTPKQKSLLIKQNTALSPTCCSSVAIGRKEIINRRISFVKTSLTLLSFVYRFSR